MLKLPEEEKSYWRSVYGESIYPKVSEDLDVDVAIVGGGITGLTAAYLLKKSGRTVAVIEKDTVGGGTTGRTTGKVTSQHSLIYDSLAQQHGEDTARIYGEANQAAVEQVAKIVAAEEISCDFARADNYVYTNDLIQVDKFKKEAETAARVGLPATFETAVPLPFETKAAVRFSNQAKFHSQRYVLGLARLVDGEGSYVFENSKATGIRDGNPCRVRTSKGRIIAKNIIVATNVPTLPLLARGGYCMLEYPTESYIVAGRPEKELKGMYISPDSDHYSILPVEIGKERILLIGGGGHISGMRLSKETRYQKLADYAEKHFAISSITHRWSDRDYISYDGIPLIGRMYPWSKHLYVGSAFRKWGLSGGTLAGMILHDLIMGADNKWASVFNPNRLKPIASIPKVAFKYLTGNS